VTGFSFYFAGVQNNLKLQWRVAVPMISPVGFAQIYNS